MSMCRQNATTEYTMRGCNKITRCILQRQTRPKDFLEKVPCRSDVISLTLKRRCAVTGNGDPSAGPGLCQRLRRSPSLGPALGELAR